MAAETVEEFKRLRGRWRLPLPGGWMAVEVVELTAAPKGGPVMARIRVGAETRTIEARDLSRLADAPGAVYLGRGR